MEFILTALVSLIILVLSAWFWKGEKSVQITSIPGPFSLPIFGNLFDIIKDPHLKLSKWGAKYGKLFGIKLGTRTAIVLSDPQVLRDVLNKPASLGKFKSEVYLLISGGCYGLINSEGKAYQEVRRVCLQNLKNYGFGNKSLEPMILNEVQSLINWINQKQLSGGNGIILNEILTISALNTLWNMVTSERIPLENKKVYKLIHEYIGALQYSVKTGLGFYPWLRYISPHHSGYNELHRTALNVKDYILEQFTLHEHTFEEGSPRDLIDSYIGHLKRTTDPTSRFYGEVGRINSVASVCELFITGGDTIALTLTWTMYYLSTHNNVQEKLAEEILKVIGNDGECSLRHKPNMPYAEAVILETLRKSSLVPLGLFQETLDELKYKKLIFPKGTILIPNIYHIHHDRKIWGDPEIFRPERFLGQGNEQFRQSLVAFQPGKRSCIGEPLAKDILFLFISKLVQSFKILKGSETGTEEYLNPEVGIMLMPKEHKLIFERR